MHAEDSAVDQRRQRQHVEHVAAQPPDLGRPVLPEALVVEPVDGGDLSALVVPPDQRDVVRVLDLVGQQWQGRYCQLPLERSLLKQQFPI
eukprot:SAG22_NODE_188_length_15821_cov_38.313319_28_plen_90_part_00